MTTRMRFTLGLTVSAALACSALVFTNASAQGAGVQNSQAVPDAQHGQSATLLPDGRWLRLGGDNGADVSRVASIVDPATGSTTVLDAPMTSPRSGHTATLLPDGTVLIVGGRGLRGQLAETPELFDPQTGAFMPIAVEGSVARAGHTATLLSDGRVLVAGGTAAGDRVLADVEIWDVQAQRAAAGGRLRGGRSGQSATLLDDGRVAMTDGIDSNGRPASQPEIFDPTVGRSVAGVAPVDDGTPARMTGAWPADGAADVPIEVRVALRFSRPLRVQTANGETVTLQGEEGRIDTHVVAAEGGRLLFVTPRGSLRYDAPYTLTIVGASDAAGLPLVAAPIGFTTAAEPRAANPASGDEEEWVPDARSRQNGWRAERPASPWESLPPLMAPPGVTAISGRVLTLDGKPLPDVSLSIEGDAETRSDRTGRFLLELKASSTARRVLHIDGKTASRPNRRYGFFEYGSMVAAGTTNVLPFTIWMPKLDTAHEVTIPSPTTSEVVVTTPLIPGLELHLASGTTIVGEDGKPVTTIGITAIPVDRPPFPLAKNVEVPVYFTIQPGGAYVRTAGAGPKGAWLVYPNYRHEYAGKRMQFYHYDPDIKDWYVYGLGTVTTDEVHVVPDARTRLYSFTGAMINGGGNPGGPGRKPGDCPCADDGDPVNLATGVFLQETTDLYLPDVLPLALTRTYRSQDQEARQFGYGTIHPYAMFLFSAQQYVQADLILPDGGRVHYRRISDGTSWTDAVFTHVEHVDPDPQLSTPATPTSFYKSIMRWNGNGWDVTLQDGTVYVFGENAPLQAIRDRLGNTITILHENGQQGKVTQVVSPNGRSIAFTYDGSGRITQAKDNIGRTVGYTYDGSGNLATVTDPENHVTSYTYDTSHRMLTVKPPNLQGTPNFLVTNEYTTAADAPTPVGWVKKQTHVDGGVYQFAYTFVNGQISQTLVTDPRGKKRRVTFNGSGYTVADRRGVDEPEEQGDTNDRPGLNNFVTSTTNTHGDVTNTQYDALGRVTSVTRLPGTADEATTTYTYDPIWPSEIATITDPLLHTTTFEYDENGNRKSIIDALNHKTSFIYNAAGQVTSMTDPLMHPTTFEYAGPDLIKITDPLGRATRRFFDGAGRLLSQTDPAGQTTRFTYDKLNNLTQTTDALGGITAYGFDTAGRLGTVTDALTHATTYTYDAFNRPASRTDPLSKTETFTYDEQGNPYQRTDRKGQVTTRSYDALNRLHQITYADTSTITYTYDSGNRLTTIADSLNGAITRTYDSLDRVTSETTPQGIVSYTYDKADRRATMTVAGQSVVTYGYDEANRLTSVTQGASTVTITYDDADRRNTLTLPNGIVATYGYDNANQLTSLAYSLGQTTLGNLTYTYDAAGRRTEVGGSFGRTALPQPLANASYDAANRIQSWAGQIFSYDPNGGLASDGLTSYAWNARNRLAALSGGVTASFTYDGFGRRLGKTVAGVTTNFLYDGINLVQELSAGAPIANLLTGLGVDETFTRTDASGTHTLLLDALGSVLALADTSGAMPTQYMFEPFGAPTRSGAISTNPLLFTGREADGTGLYDYRARYYSPETGRFVSEDLVGRERGTDLYEYAGNDPILSSDPLGLSPSQGGPPHPPAGLQFSCKDGDPCAMLLAKMGVFEALIVGHLAYDRSTGQVGRHASEIRNFREGLANCKTIFNKRCKCEFRPPPPPTPEQVAHIAELLTATALLRMLIIVLAVA